MSPHHPMLAISILPVFAHRRRRSSSDKERSGNRRHWGGRWRMRPVRSRDARVLHRWRRDLLLAHCRLKLPSGHASLHHSWCRSDVVTNSSFHNNRADRNDLDRRYFNSIKGGTGRVEGGTRVFATGSPTNINLAVFARRSAVDWGSAAAARPLSKRRTLWKQQCLSVEYSLPGCLFSDFHRQKPFW